MGVVSMAKREVVGTMQCPECGLDGAQVKRQKNGLLYRWCPDCEAQYFPRNQAASDRLAKLAGVGAVPDQELSQDREQAEPPAAVMEREESPKRKAGFDFGL